MVGIGTFITLGAVAAIVAGGYAVYSNSGKIGGALSRGIEGSLVNPLGKWADSLWASIENPSEGPAGPGPSDLAGKTVPSVNDSTITIPEDTYVNPNDTVTSKTPPILKLSPEEKSEATYIQHQNVNLSELALGKSGYYYFNVAGSKYDTQQFLSGAKAIQLSKISRENLFSKGGLENIKYIGKSALAQKGFTMFGQSQNYL